MGFKIEYGDITNFKGDAIINSLGTDTVVPGKLCRSIIDAGNNSDYEKMLADINGKAKVLDCFISDINNLKVKHLINIVTPYSQYDSDYSLYCAAYRKILNTARNNKLYRIAVPLIGTGPNGYLHTMANAIVNSMVKAYSEIYSEMDITIYHLSSYHPKEDGKDNTEQEVGELKNWITEKKHGLKNLIFNLQYVFDKKYFETKDDVVVPPNHKRPPLMSERDVEEYHPTVKVQLEYDDGVIYYINAYLNERYSTKKEIAKSKDDVRRLVGESQFKHLYERKTNSKSKLLKVAIGLKMNFEECDDFLAFYDFSTKKMNRDELILYTFIVERYYDLDEILSKLDELKIK